VPAPYVSVGRLSGHEQIDLVEEGASFVGAKRRDQSRIEANRCDRPSVSLKAGSFLTTGLELLTAYLLGLPNRTRKVDGMLARADCTPTHWTGFIRQFRRLPERFLRP
jgi:hypothetical protein